MTRHLVTGLIGAALGALIASLVWGAMLHRVKADAAVEHARLREGNKFLESYSSNLHRDVLMWRTNSPVCARTALVYSRLQERCVPVDQADTSSRDYFAGR